MTRMFSIAVVLAALFTAPQASAGILFLFTEEGDDVKMTASGSIDTSGLVATTYCGGYCVWDLVGFYSYGDVYMMGRDLHPVTQVAFGFNTGSSLEPWDSTNGPFTKDNWDFEILENDGKAFATFTVLASGLPAAGLAIDFDDLDDGIWKTSQSWLAENHTFETLGLLEGTYTITDAVSGEFMTIQVGGISVPEPSTLGLLSIGLMGLLGVRRRRQVA